MSRTPPEHDAHPEPGAEEGGSSQALSAEEREAHAEAARQRRLDEVFGSGEHHGGGKGDDWYRDQVPPHHG